MGKGVAQNEREKAGRCDVKCYRGNCKHMEMACYKNDVIDLHLNYVPGKRMESQSEMSMRSVLMNVGMIDNV